MKVWASGSDGDQDLGRDGLDLGRDGLDLGRGGLDHGLDHGLDLGRDGLDHGLDLGRGGLDHGLNLGRDGLDHGLDLGRDGLDLGRDGLNLGLDLGRDGLDHGMDLGRDGLDHGRDGLDSGEVVPDGSEALYLGDHGLVKDDGEGVDEVGGGYSASWEGLEAQGLCSPRPRDGGGAGVGLKHNWHGREDGTRRNEMVEGGEGERKEEGREAGEAMDYCTLPAKREADPWHIGVVG